MPSQVRPTGVGAVRGSQPAELTIHCSQSQRQLCKVMRCLRLVPQGSREGGLRSGGGFSEVLPLLRGSSRPLPTPAGLGRGSFSKPLWKPGVRPVGLPCPAMFRKPLGIGRWPQGGGGTWARIPASCRDQAECVGAVGGNPVPLTRHSATASRCPGNWAELCIRTRVLSLYLKVRIPGRELS